MRQLRKRVFQGDLIGKGLSYREKASLDDAAEQARGWINMHEEYEIKEISMTVGDIAAYAVVWYYEPDMTKPRTPPANLKV